MNFSVNEFWSLSATAIFAQNAVFVALLYSNTFFRSAKSPRSGLFYCGCVTFFTTFASAAAWALHEFVLSPLRAAYLAPFGYVFLIALIEIAADLLLRKFRPRLRRNLGKLLPSTAFSCAVLGLVLLNINTLSAGFPGTVFYGFCAGLGFAFSFAAAAGAQRRLQFSAPPASFAGLPLSLVTASLISLAFMGFANLQIPY